MTSNLTLIWCDNLLHTHSSSITLGMCSLSYIRKEFLASIYLWSQPKRAARKSSVEKRSLTHHRVNFLLIEQTWQHIYVFKVLKCWKWESRYRVLWKKYSSQIGRQTKRHLLLPLVCLNCPRRPPLLHLERPLWPILSNIWLNWPCRHFVWLNLQNGTGLFRSILCWPVK